MGNIWLLIAAPATVLAAILFWRVFDIYTIQVVPDAVATNPDGVRVAFELERNVKSRKRSSEVIAGHLLAIAQQKAWAKVIYITDHRCNADRLRELYMSIKEVATPNGKAPLTDAHRARFTSINLSDFRG